MSYGTGGIMLLASSAGDQPTEPHFSLGKAQEFHRGRVLFNDLDLGIILREIIRSRT